ncbi:MAG: AAA family ATPase [Proteobacteria bacterium]|nr:AAA family ATPase [Pseudomonadota bacterium]
MLKRLRVQGFKSLADIEVEFPALTVLFGPNASGKSNLLDALLILSRIATERTLADSLSGPVRGYPAELFRFPPGGLANALRALLKEELERGPDFLRLANALSALYPKDSEEKRLLDAMLLAMPR